jgi:hypothetical protein
MSHKFGYELFVLYGDLCFAGKTEIYRGHENETKFWKTEETHVEVAALYFDYPET